ncbi:orotate phosphoribosyltransferase-like protein [Halapricum sp. CBA1109]|uniref:transcriptional regulator GfcR n=1 Tax=Halapricum sp. CBA1109 TaxID=2668068 RepID=UPI0012FA10FB|nr:transcriptional regulator GfcR [Halapricum sp. CBA1109]MUV90872.1 orotate phosphoribosyltransferase-like protein [Halapricum sp. CBA1109]
MKSIDELIDSAAELTERGLSKGEIADELNVSRETASWLVEESGRDPSETTRSPEPMDTHVDWSAIGSDSGRLDHVGAIMADLLVDQGEDVDVTVGIGKSGAPLATAVGRHLDTGLSVFMPSKYHWDDDGADNSGSFSRNFSGIEGKECFVVDDNIDTGQTMTETIQRIRAHGGTPRAAVVLTDKLGEDQIDGVPVYSLVEIVQMHSD